MKISDNIRIAKLDDLNFVVEMKNEKTNPKTNETKTSWDRLGYYSSLKSALEKCKTIIINDTVKFDELCDAINYLKTLDNVKIKLVSENE